jgi:hypothetical protein
MYSAEVENYPNFSTHIFVSLTPTPHLKMGKRDVRGGFQISNRNESPSQNSSTSKMKEAFIFPGTKVEIEDVDFPTLPGDNYLIIKVTVAGSNPKDWAIGERGRTPPPFREKGS